MMDHVVWLQGGWWLPLKEKEKDGWMTLGSSNNVSNST